MPWRSAQELHDTVTSLPKSNSARLDRLYCLTRFYSGGLLASGYTADPSLVDVLVPSAAGKEALAAIETAHEVAPADLRLALACYFAHHDLLLDPEATNIETLRALLSADLTAGRLRLPMRFGRLLYDRFNTHPAWRTTEHLSPEDTDALLEQTPTGVYQVGHLVSGPLGLLDSLEPRFAPPLDNMPLWHCSDTGCQSVHQVTLMGHSTAPERAYALLAESLSDRLGPPSDWETLLDWMHRGSRDVKQPFYDLPTFLFDAVIADERRRLLETCLKTPDGAQVRSTLSSHPDCTGLSPGGLAARLSLEACAQVLLLFSTATVTAALDDSVRSGVIVVPLSELRRSKTTPPRRRYFDTRCELSSLGIREIELENSQVLLSALLMKAYNDANLLADLQWRLGADGTRSPQRALAEYIRLHGPRQAISDLALPSRPVAEMICRRFQLSLQEARDRKEDVVLRLMWKLGFDPPRYDEPLARLRPRLARLREAALEYDPTSGEAAREQIREAGVNLFVSIEELLDSLIAYNVWLLSADHFAETRFAFSVDGARRQVALVLGESLRDGESDVRWQSNGDNSLGTLLRYLSASVEWMKDLTSRNRGAIERSQDDMPHFAETHAGAFPFNHTALWADCDRMELDKYVSEYGRIGRLVAQADVATVRNGLDHKRDEARFPTSDALLACVARIQEAVDLADSQRYLPKLYWLQSRLSRRDGGFEDTLVDYRGSLAIVNGPPHASGLPEATISRPTLVAPFQLLPQADASLMFEVAGSSLFRAYWSGYPTRRRLDSSSKQKVGDAAP